MSLITFLESLNPFTKKRDIVEKIRLVDESLMNTIAMYDMAISDSITLTQGRLPTIAESVAKAIASSSYGKHRVSAKDLDGFVLALLRRCGEKIAIVRDMFTSDASGDVSKDGITYHRLTALHAVSTISFISTYAHRLLTVQTMSRSGYEDKWVLSNVQEFAKSILVIDVSNKQFLDALAAVPDKTVSADSVDTDIAIDGANTVDPLQFNLLGLSWNPFYYVGVKFAQRNIDRMEADKADLKALKFKITLLRDRRNGVEDAALEREIRVYESDAVALAEDIHKTERKYGIAG